jgi:sterol desaturase/sphingolipid hydroxylase (fatty acid hydroxylase superfamily)
MILQYADIREYGVTAVFWASVILLCVVEFWCAIPARTFDRKRRWPTNLALAVLLFAAATLMPVSALTVALWAEAHKVGLLNYFDAPLAIKIVATVALASFSAYLLHLMSHRVPLLWRLHSIHHTDTFLDVTTSLRIHPLEQALSISITCVLVLIFGHAPVVLMAYLAVESIVVIFSHSQFRLPAGLERIASLVLVTPAIHHIHHSAYQPETDSNYGNALIIWDRLLGTFRNRTRTGTTVEHYGLERVSPDEAGDLDAQLLRPFTMRTTRAPAQDAGPAGRPALSGGGD